MPIYHGKIDKTLGKKLLESDVGVFVDTTAVRAVYGAEIKHFHDEMRQAFEGGVGFFGMGGRNKNSLEMAKLILDPAFQAAPDAFDLTGFTPTYWLLNGKVYPDTMPGITAAVGSRLLAAGALHLACALRGVDYACELGEFDRLLDDPRLQELLAAIGQ